MKSMEELTHTISVSRKILGKSVLLKKKKKKCPVDFIDNSDGETDVISTAGLEDK